MGRKIIIKNSVRAIIKEEEHDYEPGGWSRIRQANWNPRSALVQLGDNNHGQVT